MNQPSRLLRILVWFITSVFVAQTTQAAPIVLADAPITTGLSVRIAPNVLFILDDSTSMSWEYMPDDVNDNRNRNCYRNFGYNTIYYNPNVTYTPPVDADGNSFPNASFTAAWNNGFRQADGVTDLSRLDANVTTTTTPGGPVTLGNDPFRTTNGSRDVRVTHTNHGLSVGDNVRFTRSNSTIISFNNITIRLGTTWYAVRQVVDANTYVIRLPNNISSNANRNGNGGGANVLVYWERITQTTTYIPTYYYTRYTANPDNPPSTCQSDNAYQRIYPADGTEAEKQNFANWYSYYRSRMLMMKTAVGKAFSNVSDEFRVGFTVISDKETNDQTFLGVQRFDEDHRRAWYNMLYSIRFTSGTRYTPLRGALSKAGRYFAGRLGGEYAAGGNKDPVQYSCQQNFAILTSDGYWNLNDEYPTRDSSTPGSASQNYGPFRMDNVTRVGNEDRDDGPPYADTYSNTLADVAAYYYKTDLRPTPGNGGPTDSGEKINVAENNVPEVNGDGMRHQRMRTFTLGLGVDGDRRYPDDYPRIVQGTLLWPDPINNAEEARIDDLWHAAVNGRGQYMSAKNASAVEEQLNDALRSIKYEPGSAAAAATSTLQPVEDDNTAFIAQYTTGHWTGDLVAREIDVTSGVINTVDRIWSAKDKLELKVDANSDTRWIFTYNPSDNVNGRKEFVSGNLINEINAGHFSASGLSQWTTLSPQQRNAATADAMIRFLRGQTGNEFTGNVPAGDNEVFRNRAATLGDIGSAAPVFVRRPPMAYVDAGYAQFISDQANRVPTVYVGANDGMLHAFDASTGATGGNERWAYVPSMVIPNLKFLADAEYSTHHRYYVDGPIVVGDAYDGSRWATLLVGGLGHGGKGYYALDVTNPTQPKVLWEFSVANDPDIGYSYGNPIITKRDSDGKWVVVFASGYNNGSDGGDGRGRLYVVDAFTGGKLSEIITHETLNDESLTGIARISNYVEDGMRNNLTRYVYGGDLYGMLWRFDINVECDECTTGRIALARTHATPGAQPITVQPEMARVKDGPWRVIYFGTGRALGPNDLTDSDPSNGTAQAVYAVKDTDGYIGVLSSENSGMVSQTLREANAAEIAAGDTSRKIDPLVPVNWSINNGWYITVPLGERFTVDPGLQLGTLVIAANIHESGYCEPTGSSVLYQLDYRSGQVLKTNEYAAQIVGITQLQTRGGSGPVVIDPVFADGSTGNTPQAGVVGGTGSAVRVSWREIE